MNARHKEAFIVRFTRIRAARLVAVLSLSFTVPALASSDELYYPASNYQPFNGTGWQGGGSSGFAFQPWREPGHAVSRTRSRE